MTRVGIITDAHANLPALTAALEALDEHACDFVVHTGDAIGIGPHPAEVLEVLLDRPNTHLVMGNHDALFAFGLPAPRPEWMSEEEADHQRWTHSQIDVALREAVGTWPYALDINVEETSVRFCHYARAANDGGFVSVIQSPSAFDLDRPFNPGTMDVVFFGHDHQLSDLQGKARYINPGSLGCHTLPEARFAVLECKDGETKVQLNAVQYEPGSLFKDFERRDVPARSTILKIFFEYPRVFGSARNHN